MRDVLNFIEIKDPPRRVPLTVDFEFETLAPPSRGSEASVEETVKEVY